MAVRTENQKLIANCIVAAPASEIQQKPADVSLVSSAMPFSPVLALVRARVRTRDVFIEIRGIIPGALLEVLRLEYGCRVIESMDVEMPMKDVLSAPLYEREPQQMRPGDFLRFYRCKKCLTQSELCKELVGLYRQNISGMEGGKRPIGKRMASKLAGFFGVSPSRFLG